MAPKVFLALAIAVLWTTTLADHCTDEVLEREDRKDPCCDAFALIIEGWTLNKEKSEMSGMSSDQIKANLVSSRICVFYREVKKTIDCCCPGWRGDDCDIRVCDPPCENDAECVEGDYGNVCRCRPGYERVCCDELTDPGEGSGYCYMNSNCQGPHVKGTGAVMKSECCDGMNGVAWGKAGDNKCYPCETSHPILPGVIIVKGSSYCAGYSRNLYKTFDGVLFAFDGQCTYLLYSDGIVTLTVTMSNCDQVSTCVKTYSLRLTDTTTIICTGHDNIFMNGKRIAVSLSHGFASIFPGVTITVVGRYVSVSYGGLLFRYTDDYEWYLQMDDSILPADRSAMRGMCGNCNGNQLDDLVLMGGAHAPSVAAYGNSYALTQVSGPCSPCAEVPDYCCKDEERRAKAHSYCSYIMSEVFLPCREKMPSIYTLCMNEMCHLIKDGCTDSQIEIARCSIFAAYATVCYEVVHLRIEWRIAGVCPSPICPAGFIYSERCPSCQPTCASLGFVSDDPCVDALVPGCVCPSGYFLHDDKCVKPEACPCVYQHKSYHPGDKVYIDCNQCECEFGRWVCDEKECPRTCSVVGSQHYKTFDGLTYSYQGTVGCSYILVRTKSNANTPVKLTIKKKKVPTATLR